MLTVKADAQTKVYGTANPPLTFKYSGWLNGEDEAALTTKPVAITDVTLLTAVGNHIATIYVSGGIDENYYFNYILANFTVTKAVLTVTGASAASKVYDGTTAAVVSGGKLSGVFGSDAVTLATATSGTFAAAGVGSGIGVATAMTLNGVTSRNYSLTQPTLSANITPREVTLTGTSAANKVYDGTTAALISGGTLSGIVGSDEVILSNATTGTFAGSGVHSGTTVTTTMTITGVSSGNYSLTKPALTADITARELTIGGSLTVNDKVYDGSKETTTAANHLTLSSIVPGDVVNLNIVPVFETKNAGAAKNVVLTGGSLTGPAAANYTLSLTGAPLITAAILAKELSISGVVANTKIYDAGVEATLSGAKLAGIVTGDDVTPDLFRGTFAQSSIGSAIAVTGAMTIKGADSENYRLTQPAGLKAAITPRVLIIGGSFKAADKVYDSKTVSTIGANNLTLNPVASGDVINLLVSATFDTKNVGTAKLVSITSPALSGTNASNYTLSSASMPTSTASITKADLTVSGLSAGNKVYDASVTASLTGTAAVSPLAGDVITLGGLASGSFASKNAGTGKSVTVKGITISGTDAGNYNVSQKGGLTATITPKSITISGSFTAIEKVYDGTPNVAITAGSLLLLTPETGDDVRLNGIALLDNKKVGTGKLATLMGSSLVGADAANYALSFTGAPTSTATVTARELTIGGSFTAGNKVFDGTTTATIGANNLTLVTPVAGDVVTLAGVVSFVNASAGPGRVVTLAGSSLGGADASNYKLSINQAPVALTTITPKIIRITPAAGQVKTMGSPDPVFAFTNSEWSDNSRFSGALSRTVGEIAGTYSYNLEALFAGSDYALELVLAPSNFTISVASGVGDLVNDLKLLLGNYPNPFTVNTTISYTLPADGAVLLQITNIMGQQLEVLVDERQTEGDYTIGFGEGQLQPGVYMAHLVFKTNGQNLVKTIKMVKK
jgi:hypothetical protein